MFAGKPNGSEKELVGAGAGCEGKAILLTAEGTDFTGTSPSYDI